MAVWHTRTKKTSRRNAQDQSAQQTLQKLPGFLLLLARDVSGIAAGGDVSTWPNRLGTDFTQSSPSLRPSFHHAPARVEFDSVGEYVAVPAGETPATDKLCVFVVGKSVGGIFRIGLEQGNPAYFNTNGFVVGTETGPWVGTGATTGGFRIGTALKTQASLIYGRFDRSTNPDGVELFEDGRQITSFSSQGSTNGVGNYADNQISIGDRPPGGFAPWGGPIHAVYATSDLTDQELANAVKALLTVVPRRP